MTQEEIIELVMQIGGCDRPEENSPALKMFVTFAKLVAEHEREMCAKVCDDELKKWGIFDSDIGDVSKAIRARGNHD